MIISLPTNGEALSFPTVDSSCLFKSMKYAEAEGMEVEMGVAE